TSAVWAAVERNGVVEEEIDLFELLRLDVEYGVGELAQLAGVVPVTMADDYPDHAIGIQPDGPHLIFESVPATRGVPVEDVGELFPPAVVQRDVPVRGLDDPDVHRQVDERGVADVGLECAMRHIQEPAAFGVSHPILSAS